jgi:lysozyme
MVLSQSLLRWLVLGVLVSAGVGCTQHTESEDQLPEEFNEVRQPLSVCPAGETTEGIDVSYYQGTINWSAVKTSDVKFAIARTSDGSFEDPKFAENWAGIKSAGLVRGAYHFFRPAQDPIEQANRMLKMIGTLESDDLPPVLDVEATDSQPLATIQNKIEQWVTYMKMVTGRNPIIYSGKYFWQDNVKSAKFVDLPLWIAAYTSTNCPNLPDQWADWAMHQYTDKGVVPGINGNVDRNRFNGSLTQLLQFAKQGTDWSATFVSQSFPLASDGSLTLEPGEKVQVSIELRNSGSQDWDGNTKLGTTAPRDRPSPFATSDWDAPHRPAHVIGTIKPSEIFTFIFTIQAPSEPGTYHEHFGLVQEGTAWFGDPGQGGPPDEQIEAVIVVKQVEPGSGGSGGNAGMAGQAGENSSGYGLGGSAGTSGGNLKEKSVVPTFDFSRRSNDASCQWSGPIEQIRTPFRAWLGLGLLALFCRRSKRSLGRVRNATKVG